MVGMAPPTPLVRFLDLGPDAVGAQTVLPGVRADDVYAMVSTPRRHHELDGGGTVRAQIEGPEHPGVGESTTQAMKLYGIPYRMTATVVRAQPDRAFAWRMPGGHTWAWEIEPAGPSPQDGILVREVFDASAARLLGLPLAPVYRLDGGFARNRRSIALTLSRLHRLFPPQNTTTGIDAGTLAADAPTDQETP